MPLTDDQKRALASRKSKQTPTPEVNQVLSEAAAQVVAGANVKMPDAEQEQQYLRSQEADKARQAIRDGASVPDFAPREGAQHGFPEGLPPHAQYGYGEPSNGQFQQTFEVPIGNPELADAMRRLGEELAGEVPSEAEIVQGPFDYMEAPLVKGLTIPEQLSQDEKEAIMEMVFSYLGAPPRKIDQYTGRWMRCLGCVVAPITADVTTVDRHTGDIVTKTMSWDAPLFKMEAIDDVTGMNIVLTGGGRYGLKFATAMSNTLGVGDWKASRDIFISQEGRTGINQRTGESEPRRMYRF